MYPHVIQFETRDAELRDRLQLDAERRAAEHRRSGGERVSSRSPRGLRALLTGLLPRS
jgi:hypothetical protein